jgi:uncharacterized repeat protein (TIGR01451 family)
MTTNTSLPTIATALLGASLMAVPTSHSAAAGLTTRVSVSSAGQQGDKLSRFQTFSADGRFVAFSSEATNLVTGDTNGKNDIFLRDQLTGETTRLSVATGGDEANNASYNPLVSANGRYVLFTSYASNLVPNDTNNWSDAFILDRVTGSLERIVNDAGKQLNGNTYVTDISADGRFVGVASEADNLVLGDTNGQNDVFIIDRATGITERVDVASDGGEANVGSWYYALLSDDGRYVAYYSDSSNLVPGDTNGQTDVFVRDRFKKTTTRISVGPNGEEGNNASYFPKLSSNGRFIAFTSQASNLVDGDTNGRTDVFLYDQLTGKPSRVSLGPDGVQGDGDSTYPDISSDGRFVSYYSSATNLVARDTNGVNDVFLYDRLGRKTTRISVGKLGRQGNAQSFLATMNNDGRYVGFFSEATNLVANDTNAVGDVFLRDRLLTAGKSSDLSVTQTDSPDPIRKGRTTTYSLTVHNAGPDAAPNVVLTDIVPSRANFVSATASQGSCSRGKTVICRVGQLAAGSDATVTLKARATAAGELLNQAHVNGTPQDPEPLNNISIATTTVTP